MTPSIESEFDQIKQKVLMNPVSRVFSEIRKLKQEINERNAQLYLLKREVDEHYEQGNIKEKHSEEGVTVSRKSLPKKYIFSEVVTNLERDLKKKKQDEIDDDIAVEQPTGFTWQFTLKKSED